MDTAGFLRILNEIHLCVGKSFSQAELLKRGAFFPPTPAKKTPPFADFYSPFVASLPLVTAFSSDFSTA